MVSKCANPECKTKFTYFGTGELLVKNSPITGRQELFWLCQRCATDWNAPGDFVPLKGEDRRIRKKITAA
jgi:hypothetical protein